MSPEGTAWILQNTSAGRMDFHPQSRPSKTPHSAAKQNAPPPTSLEVRGSPEIIWGGNSSKIDPLL